nr:hypothetical protein CFP56_23984 [Quercus suber]
MERSERRRWDWCSEGRTFQRGDYGFLQDRRNRSVSKGLRRGDCETLRCRGSMSVGKSPGVYPMSVATQRTGGDLFSRATGWSNGYPLHRTCRSAIEGEYRYNATVTAPELSPERGYWHEQPSSSRQTGRADFRLDLISLQQWFML